jgi:hypothetical protein
VRPLADYRCLRIGSCWLTTAAALFGPASAAGQVVHPGVVPRPQEVTLTRAGGVLHGTLLALTDNTPVPAVLIHPGSGPTDRDGN